MNKVILELQNVLKENNGKIPYEFLQEQIAKAEIIHHRMTLNTRVCVIKLETGHEVVGYAQVLDSKNDIEEIGQQIAMQRASDELWSVFGSIAKVL